MADDNKTDDNADDPKIVVDSDWKEQVAKEREAEAEDQDAASDDTPTTSGSGEAESAGEIPPATFEVLLSMLFTQAMSMLGQIPDPSTGETRVDKPIAKHTIDMLEMLGEKTKGNLSEDETKMHGEALHALRMAFVSVQG